MSVSDPQEPFAGDSTGIAKQLVGKYLPPGFMESLIRTCVPVGVGAAITWLAVHWRIVLPPGASATAGIVTSGLVIAGYYALARIVERRWPRVGRWMIALNLVRAKPPVYLQQTENAKIVDSATGGVRHG
jgi:hypothetical protein